MPASITHGEEEPLFTLGDFPVRLITLLVGLHSIAMIACALLLSAGHGDWVNAFAYNSSEVAQGQIWRLFTYAFVAQPDIWFLFQMLMLYYFGKEVENGLGWKRFAILYAGLILIGPLLLQAFGYAGIPQTAVGVQDVGFAIFAAFVAMHPGAQFFFGMAARWVFVALLTISSLQYLAAHQPPRLLVLISSSLMAIMLMRRVGFEEPLFGWGFEWSLPGFQKPKPRFSVVPRDGASSSASTKSIPKNKVMDPLMEMDLLLEKISSKGIDSLSRDERTALEKARQAILQREGGR
ncbi:MAG: rhomboid family intramembrane serine protease [bacterium]